MVASRRVLIVNRVGHLGGVERIILTLAAGLEAEGWEPLVACPGEGTLPEAARAQGTPVLACPFDRMRITGNPLVLAGYPVAWLRCAALLETQCRARHIDLIHAHHPVSALYALRAARRLRIPLVLHVHETMPARPLYAAAMGVVLRHAAQVVCVSRAAAELALAQGADPLRLSIVQNGVDPRFFEPDPPPPAPEVLAAGPGPHVGLFAVLEPRKAQHLLIAAAERLAERFPAARFWIVGAAALADKQGYAEALRRMAEAPALRGRVMLPGFRADIPAWLAAMDVVVQTSVELESFGMALAEAQALGRPVIASRVGGMPEVVIQGETGMVVPPADAEALAEALAALLGDATLRREMGERGAAAARLRFAPEVFAHRVADAYARAIAGAAPRTGARAPVPSAVAAGAGRAVPRPRAGLGSPADARLRAQAPSGDRAALLPPTDSRLRAQAPSGDRAALLPPTDSRLRAQAPSGDRAASVLPTASRLRAQAPSGDRAAQPKT